MKRNLRGVVIATLVAILGVAGLAGSADAVTRQVALGVAYYNPKTLANPGGQANGGYLDLSLAETYKANYGRYPATWMVWSDWGGSNAAFPTALMDGLKQRGIVPIVNWEPLNPALPTDCQNWSIDRIIDGSHDDYIRQWATAAKANGGQILLRFAHEMNQTWFVWGYQRCAISAKQSPIRFKQAWIHVWNIVKGTGLGDVGAANVKFVWNPFSSNKVKAYYPGTDYVDYAGVTAFNWGPDGAGGHTWISMAAAMAPTMSALGKAGIVEPIISVETGAGYYTDQVKYNKATWITTGYKAVFKKYKKLAVIVYFDIDMTFQHQPNWRLNYPPAAQVAYHGIATMPKFQGVIPATP